MTKQDSIPSETLIEKLTRERDALLRATWPCHTCKFKQKPKKDCHIKTHECERCEEDCTCRDCAKGSKWELREEEQNELDQR